LARITRSAGEIWGPASIHGPTVHEIIHLTRRCSPTGLRRRSQPSGDDAVPDGVSPWPPPRIDARVAALTCPRMLRRASGPAARSAGRRPSLRTAPPAPTPAPTWGPRAPAARPSPRRTTLRRPARTFPDPPRPTGRLTTRRRRDRTTRQARPPTATSKWPPGF